MRILFSTIVLAVFLAPVVQGADMVGLSNTVLDLSVQNQALKAHNTIISSEKELAEASLAVCEEKLEKNVSFQVDARKEADMCAAVLSRIDKDKEDQKRALDQLRDENARLEKNNQLLLKDLDKNRAMGGVVQKSSRMIMNLGDEKAAVISEKERLIKLNADLEWKAREAVKKAEAIVSRKAREFIRAVPRRVDVPRDIKNLKIKNARLGAQNVQLVQINADLERKSKEFFIKANALKVRMDDNKSLANALKAMNKEHDALKAEHARVRDELNDLRRKLDMERASIYREVGAAYVKREFFDEAISAYLDALKLDPQDPLTHYYLGIIYSKVGQEGQSLHYLRKYLKLHPQAENREEVLYIMSFIEDQSL